jgi:hypothetical protein
MNRLMFRVHPELAPSGKVTIFGQSLCPVERMDAYAARRNPKAPKVARSYLEKAVRYGIRGDLAFCQAMHDTRVWMGGPQGASWPDTEWENAVEQHLNRLFVFASEQLAEPACWEDLNGKWAVPGPRYGQDIVAIWRNMMDWKGESEWVGDIGEDRKKPADEAEANGTLTNEQALAWLAGRAGVPSPPPHPDRKVTWGELARLLRVWERGGEK